MTSEINIEKIKNVLDRHNYSRVIFNFLLKYSSKLAIVMAVAMLFYVVYIWYGALYNPKWSDFRKQEYVRSKEKGTIFSTDKFESITSEFESRKKEFQNKSSAPVDIFRIKK